MKMAVAKPVAGSVASATSVTPRPLLSRNQFEPSRRLLATPIEPLKSSFIRRRSSARTVVSSVFWRKALMPATALLAVKTPRSMVSSSAPSVPR